MKPLPPPLDRLEEGLCLRLPEDLRPLAALRYPRGVLLASPPRGTQPLVTVGDRVTEDAVRLGAKPLVSVYDCREVRRERSCPETGAEVRLEAWSPPAHVSWEAVRVLADAVGRARRGSRVDILVKGEEDLLILPLALLADHGWLLAYGQPGVGVVTVMVDNHAKLLASMLLHRMVITECPLRER